MASLSNLSFLQLPGVCRYNVLHVNAASTTKAYVDARQNAYRRARLLTVSAWRSPSSVLDGSQQQPESFVDVTMRMPTCPGHRRSDIMLTPILNTPESRDRGSWLLASAQSYNMAAARHEDLNSSLMTSIFVTSFSCNMVEGDTPFMGSPEAPPTLHSFVFGCTTAVDESVDQVEWTYEITDLISEKRCERGQVVI
jgi:hypothetical protein